MGFKKKNVCSREAAYNQAAFESLSSLMVFFLGSFFSRSNHMTSTRFFLMYFKTSITFPSVLLRTCSPFLNSLLIFQSIVLLPECIVVFTFQILSVGSRKNDQLTGFLIFH